VLGRQQESEGIEVIELVAKDGAKIARHNVAVRPPGYNVAWSE
jgi:hypothetical protein